VAPRSLMCRFGFLLLFLLTPLFFTANPVFAEEFKFHDKPHFLGTTLKSDWCGEVVDLKIKALQDPSIFNPPDSVYLQQKVLGVSLVAMSVVCPEVKKITLSGWFQGELYFAGAASKENDWRLVGLYVEP
jgi:hypothetical protein